MQVNSIRQENDKKEADLKSKHAEEVKRMQLKAENELREVLTSLSMAEA